MGTTNYNFNPTHDLISSFHHHLLLFLFSIVLFVSLIRCGNSQSPTDPLIGLGCKFIDCGQGTCKASNGSLLPFDCECNSGWKKIQIGPLTYPACIVPDCTINFDCGGASPPLPPPPPPPPPPPAPLFPPPGNTSNDDPCTLTWCGVGTCLRGDSGAICQCNEGSANLFNLKGYACFKECSFGADCHGLGLGLGPQASPPPPPSSGSTKNGGGVPNSSRAQQTLTMLLLIAILLSWF